MCICDLIHWFQECSINTPNGPVHGGTSSSSCACNCGLCSCAQPILPDIPTTPPAWRLNATWKPERCPAWAAVSKYSTLWGSSIYYGHNHKATFPYLDVDRQLSPNKWTEGLGVMSPSSDVGGVCLHMWWWWCSDVLKESFCRLNKAGVSLSNTLSLCQLVRKLWLICIVCHFSDDFSATGCQGQAQCYAVCCQFKGPLHNPIFIFSGCIFFWWPLVVLHDNLFTPPNACKVANWTTLKWNMRYIINPLILYLKLWSFKF